ncbi:MAG: DUF3761 domain-containing protein [Sphingomicrobium sp.]
MSPNSGPEQPSPKKPGVGTWLGIAGAVVIAFAWGHSTGSSTTSPASATPAGSQAAADLQTPAPTAPETFNASPAASSDAAADSDDDQSASTDDANASGTDDATCDDDSYVSSDGDCVHRPVAAATAPASASAQCNDGTYSFSEHRSGTCSHHGGVAEWL